MQHINSIFLKNDPRNLPENSLTSQQHLKSRIVGLRFFCKALGKYSLKVVISHPVVSMEYTEIICFDLKK